MNAQLFHSLLRAQAGVASIDQLRRTGLTVHQIKGMRTRGDLVSIHPNVLRSPLVPASWESDVIAAALFLGDRALASHETSARLLGIDPFTASTAIEFAAYPKRRGVGGIVPVHTARRLELVDRTVARRAIVVPDELLKLDVVTEIRCTTAARTIVDLAARVTADTLGTLIDSAAAKRLTTPDVLAKRLEALRGSGVSGVRMLSEVMLDAGGHSWLERRFLKLMRTSELPKPRCQVGFRSDGKTIARVDFHYDGTNVIIEVSGRRGHVSEADRKHDAGRRNALQQAGYRVIEFVTSHVIDDPDYVVATVRAALAGVVVPLVRAF